MCQSNAEGGRRCPDYERLKNVSASDVAPDPTHDVPDVLWRDDRLTKTWGDGTADHSAACAALGTLENAKADEPDMTRSVMQAAGEAGGECAYLDSRVKSPESLARKIREDRATMAARGEKISAGEIAEGLKDVVRYTVVRNDHSQTTETIVSTVTSLQRQGWVILQIKDFYRDGAPYKGVHVIGRAPSGRVSEIQVHSAQSLAIKNQAHTSYEVYRDSSRSLRDRQAAKTECSRAFSNVSAPPGLNSVKRIGGVEVTRLP